MSLSWDIMKEIVARGGNLIIHDTEIPSWDVLKELAHTAKRVLVHTLPQRVQCILAGSNGTSPNRREPDHN